jgi:4-hydroxy-tetrahydrodipicolinate reductase
VAEPRDTRAGAGRIRVAQWGTGNAGSVALGAILDDPDLELVALWVARSSSASRDASELAIRRAGTGAVGVAATTDPTAVLAARPDCVVYMATDRDRAEEVVDDLATILAAGINVVATTMPMLVHPDGAGPVVRARLAAACASGNSSFLCTGIEPGFTADALVLTLSSLSREITRVHVQEAMNVGSYRVPRWRSGLGNNIHQDATLYREGHIARGWTGVLTLLADGLGVTLEEIREVRRVAAAGRVFEVPAGRYGPDDVAALNFQVIGVVGGEPRLVVDHTYRLLDEVAPDWPQPLAPDRRTTRIRISGVPDIDVTLELGGAGLDPTDQGVLGTAMRAVHAIPAVVAAPAGMRTSLDLPVIVGRHAMAP